MPKSTTPLPPALTLRTMLAWLAAADRQFAPVVTRLVPSEVGMFPGLGGAFTIAELADGARAAYVDSQAAAQIIDQPSELVTLDRRWERIRGEALPRGRSLEFLREAARAWT